MWWCILYPVAHCGVDMEGVYHVMYLHNHLHEVVISTSTEAQEPSVEVVSLWWCREYATVWCGGVYTVATTTEYTTPSVALSL